MPRTQHISHDRISVCAIRRMAQVAFITSADPFQTASQSVTADFYLDKIYIFIRSMLLLAIEWEQFN